MSRIILMQNMGEVSYSARQLLEVLRMDARQLRRWQRWRLFPRRRRYGWAELVRARALRQIDTACRGSRQVRESLRAACLHFPELTDPLMEASWFVNHGRLRVRHGGVCMDALTGQLALPFATPPARQRPNTGPLIGRPPEQPTAEQWFTFGLTLEGDPASREQAVAAYHRCLELDPGFACAHINLGTLHYHGQDYAGAERAYRAALRLDPGYALARFNLGNVLDETGRIEEAIAEYLEAVRLAPNYADAHYNLALAYQRRGERRRAVPHWRQYLGLDRQSPWATHARTQLKLTLAQDGLRLVPKSVPGSVMSQRGA
ncbi:MAG TPA: tetratricopeptide repeat protein [Terriglobales bacterium]